LRDRRGQPRAHAPPRAERPLLDPPARPPHDLRARPDVTPAPRPRPLVAARAAAMMRRVSDRHPSTTAPRPPRTLGKALGPGLLFAGAAVGVSHLVQSTRAGASFGLALMVFVLAANVFKYPAFQFGPRYAIAT